MNTLFLPVASLFITVLVSIIFHSKENIDNSETRLYRNMLVTNFVFGILAVLGFIFAKTNGNIFVVSWIQKIYMISMILLIVYMIVYNINITNIKDKFKKVLIDGTYISFILFSILTLITPLEVINYGDILDGKGLSYDIILIAVIIYLILTIIFSIYNFIKNKNNFTKIIPFITLIMLYVLGIIVRTYFPSIMFENFFFSYMLLIMYFTIENPDMKMIASLNIAKEQAEKANRAKSDFLSSMSHEIRTPLNAIVGLSEDMEERDICPSEMKEDLHDVVSASRTLLEIVGNIMDINKIESDKMEIVSIPYNFKEEIEVLTRVQGVRIGDKNIDYKVSFAPDIPYELIGDKVHVKQVVNNLISNAIKYTEKGFINFNVKCINKDDICTLIITCKDSGRGIKAEDINKLFTKFERLDIEKNTTAEGTGLGLAITKKLVEMMGGSINVNSKYGFGSIFMVQLPQKISKQTKPITNDKNIINDTVNEYKTYKDKKILVVDDNKLNIKVARRALEPFDFELIDECLNGTEVLDKIKNGSNYDLILMDIMMPIMGGEETLRELKKLPDFNIPVIALTADAIVGSENKYRDEGFTDYVAKPFSKDTIKDKIDNIFRKYI